MSNVVSWSRTDDGDDGVVITDFTPLKSPDESEVDGLSSTQSSDTLRKNIGWSSYDMLGV